MSSKPVTLPCPNCKHPLEILISLALGTDFMRTKEILNQMSAAELTNQQLDTLEWRQSQKRQALSTLRVTPELLNVPIARLLYDRLRAAANETWKIDRVTYKLSQTDTMEFCTAKFLQRWSPVGK